MRLQLIGIVSRRKIRRGAKETVIWGNNRRKTIIFLIFCKKTKSLKKFSIWKIYLGVLPLRKKWMKIKMMLYRRRVKNSLRLMQNLLQISFWRLNIIRLIPRNNEFKLFIIIFIVKICLDSFNYLYQYNIIIQL